MDIKENKALFWILFKNVFETRNILLLLLIVFLFSIFPISFMPFQASLSIIVLFTVIFVGGIVFNSTYKFKQSTLFLSINKTSKFKIYFYLQTLILMLISILISLMLLMTFLLVFNELNLLIYWWPWQQHSGGNTIDFRITNNHYLLWVVLYNAFIETLLLFSISFMLRNVLKTQKSYLVFLITLTIFGFTLGSTFNNCFSSNGLSNNFDYNPYLINFRCGRKHLFNISLLFPFYAPTQITTAVINDSFTFAYLSLEENFNYVNAWHWYSIVDDPFFIEHNQINPLWHWNILYVLPVVEIFIFSLIGLKLR